MKKIGPIFALFNRLNLEKNYNRDYFIRNALWKCNKNLRLLVLIWSKQISINLKIFKLCTFQIPTTVYIIINQLTIYIANSKHLEDYSKWNGQQKRIRL